MKRIMKILFPPGSRRRKMFEKTLKKFGIHRSGIDPMYQLVLEKSGGIQRILPKNLTITKTPLISIVVPTYNPNKLFFETLINSVLNQSYENFELLIVDGSNEKKILRYLATTDRYDPRIRRITVTNKGISATTNAGIRIAKGEYVALLDHDDILHPDALLYMVAMINKHSDGDLFYSDECKLSENGEIFRMAHFKPDFSPDLLLNLNYITHFSLIKKEVFNKVGLFDKDKDGAQDYDMFLRIADYSKNIYHVPRVLYYWRESKGSTSMAFENKKDLAQAGISSLEDHFKRTKVTAKVKIIKKTPGFYESKIFIPKTRVAVLISAPNSLYVVNYMKTLRENTATKKHVIKWFIVSEKTPEDTAKLIRSLKEKFDTVIAITDHALPINERWLNELVAAISQKHIGIVAPTIIDNFGRITYKGDVRVKKEVYSLFFGLEHNERTNFGDVNWDRNVDDILRGVMCFKTSLLPTKPITNFNDLVTSINKQCSEQGLYKTSLGRCYLEQVSPGEDNFETMLATSQFFNQNLFYCGFYEDFPIKGTLQLPVTSRFNVLVDPDE